MAPTELSIIRRHDRPFFIVLRKISLGDGDYVLSCMCIPVYLELSSNINSETGLHVFAQSRESPQVPATADENRKRMRRKRKKEATNNGHSRLCKVNTSPSLNKGLVHVKCLFHASWAMCVSCSKQAHNARSLSLHFESTPFPPIFLRFFFSSQQVPNFGLQNVFLSPLFSTFSTRCWNFIVDQSHQLHASRKRATFAFRTSVFRELRIMHLSTATGVSTANDKYYAAQYNVIIHILSKCAESTANFPPSLIEYT